jgi:maltose alpha-D-glucosyltransferase/alpha-amylase
LFLPTRRWFAAKGERIRTARLRAAEPWGEWLLATVRVGLESGDDQDYLLPLAILWEGPDDERILSARGAALAKVRRQARPGLMCDAFADERFVRALVRAIGEGRDAPFGPGRLEFSPTAAFAELAAGGALEGELRLPPEGSNSTAALGQRLFLKAYRRVLPGLSPEAEMGRFLTEVSPFAQSVPLAGTLLWRDPEGPGTVATLALVQGYVPNQGDLWQHSLAHLERLCAEYGARPEPEWVSDAAQVAYAGLVGTLGRRTAELHRALARPGGGPAFDPEPIREGELAAWGAGIRREADLTLERLARGAEALPEGAREAARALGERGGELAARIADLLPVRLAAVKTRYHGDFHLGQVLVVENDVVLVDFEGEPARGLEERRAKHSPLRDVAGMLRSFDYAAYAVLDRVSAERPDERPRLEPLIGRWRREMSERFLAGYREAAAGAPFYPDEGEAPRLLDLFALEKALYEVRYELDQRPDWVGVPLRWLLRFLEGTDG